MLRIDTMQHPDYTSGLRDWAKWRLCYEGGDAFKNAYLKTLSTREEAEDYERRKQISPVTRFAGAAIDEIANSITVRLPDVKRIGGSETYLKACDGKDGGVDRRGLTMNAFLAQNVLPEMLVMRQCIVFVDKEPIKDGSTLADAKDIKPYLYYYPIEDIMSWDTYYNAGVLSYKTILIRQNVSVYDDVTGLPVGVQCRYLRMWIDGRNKVSAQYYVEKKVPEAIKQPGDPETWFEPQEIIELELTIIPVVDFSIKKSLMEDVADHQIALLNMESADVAYAFGSNFPFYTEQYAAQEAITHLKVKDPQTGEEKTARERMIGVQHGRRYPMGADRPEFIHPSSEPLEVSMKKEHQLKEDIRQLIGLSVTTLQPGHASAESKGVDNQTIEAGLANIGIELQLGEQRVAQIWAEYQKDKPTDVIYPTNYTLVTESQRQERAKNYKDLQGAVPSKTFQKEMSKEIARTLLEGKIPQDKLHKMISEVESAQHITSDYEEIAKDLEMGLVSEITASNARGYNGETEVPKARIEHAERAARILLAQTAASGKAGDTGGSGAGDPSSRGSSDLSADSSAADEEKKVSQDPNLNPDKAKKVRS